MIGLGPRRWRRAAYPSVITGPLPDVMIDFATGRGLPTANGGAGGRGSELVQAITPQDSAGGARLVRAPRYWDLQAEWQPGEPIFVPKQANRLVGWPGPRAGGYWTGPMPSRSSATETVSVYDTITGRTVSEVAGGVVGPAALRVDVAAGQSGDDWAAMPAPVMTSGWITGDDGTIGYVNGVVELLGSVGDYRCRVALVSDTTVIEEVTQRYDATDVVRSGKIYRGVGPHGGQLYEIWAIVRLMSTPPASIVVQTYLLSSGAGGNPARSLVIHGLQQYLVPKWSYWPIVGVPPFFSYARGSAVVWTAETLTLGDVTGAYTAAINHSIPAYDAGLAGNQSMTIARNNYIAEAWCYRSPSQWTSYNPPKVISPANPRRAVARVASDYARATTLDGQTIQAMGAFDGSVSSPSYLAIGSPQDRFFGQMRRVLLWLRALSDTEMLQAWRAL